MRTGNGCDQYQFVVVILIQQQPIGFYMTFSKILEAACQLMIVELGRQRISRREHIEYAC